MKSLTRTSLLSGIGCVTAAIGAIPVASPAAAQSTAVGTVEDQINPGDIIVTAQRRRERLQDVPIAVTAVTSQSLDQYAVGTTLDLTRAVPGFLVQQRNLNATPYLRGIGNENGSPGDEPSVSTYVDGVYRASSAASTFSLNNIERIEVLKGPQGTLFGRNSIGGVINIITREPSQDFKAKVRLGYGNYDTIQADGYISGGLAPNLAADFSVYFKDQRDGWGKNVATGNDAYTQDSIAIRSKWKLDLGRSAFTLIGDWSRDRYFGGWGVTAAMLPGQQSALDGNMYFAGLYNINTEIDPFIRFKNYGGSLKFEHELGWADFVSITGYRETKAELYADSDATPLSFVRNITTGQQTINFRTSTPKDQQFTQEVQLMASPGSKFHWILGAFYLNGTQRSRAVLELGALGPGVFSTSSAKLPNRSLALYGQSTFGIFPNTNLTLGARYTIDRRKRTFYREDVPQPESFPSKTWKEPTWRVALDHKFTPDIMAYASYNRGYKSGLYENSTNVRPPINPQKLDAFEAGIKSQLFNRRLTFNAAAFYYKISNFQISAVAPTGTTLLLLNAAKARIYGADFELTARPVRRLTLQLSGTFTNGKFTEFLDAPSFVPRTSPPGFVGWGNIPVRIDASGRVTNNTPKRAINASVQYDIPLGENELSLSVSDSYTSAYYIAVDHLNRIEPRHLVNASARLSLGKQWEVRGWVQNLFDRNYFIHKQARNTGHVGLAGAPRTYGVTVGFEY